MALFMKYHDCTYSEGMYVYLLLIYLLFWNYQADYFIRHPKACHHIDFRYCSYSLQTLEEDSRHCSSFQVTLYNMSIFELKECTVQKHRT